MCGIECYIFEIINNIYIYIYIYIYIRQSTRVDYINL